MSLLSNPKRKTNRNKVLITQKSEYSQKEQSLKMKNTIKIKDKGRVLLELLERMKSREAVMG